MFSKARTVLKNGMWGGKSSVFWSLKHEISDHKTNDLHTQMIILTTVMISDMRALLKCFENFHLDFFFVYILCIKCQYLFQNEMLDIKI